MHEIGTFKYSGDLGEAVTVTTTMSGPGAVGFTLNNVHLPSVSPLRFNLGTAPGETMVLSVALVAGSAGNTCLVSISPVDGADDKDLLVAEPHSQFPIHKYTFVALAPSSLALAAALKPAAKGGK